MKYGLYAAAAAFALAFAGGAAAQPQPGACAAAPLAGQWEWQERPGAHIWRMEITPGAHGCSIGVLAHWAQSLVARHFWQFTAHWDAASGSWVYTGARHWREAAMAPAGQPPRQSVQYEDGSGALRLAGGVLRWEERKEGACAQCRFTKVDATDIPAVPDALALVAARDISGALRVIGSDGKGLRIAFTSVQRSADDPLRYTVTGKTHTGSGDTRQVRAFTGTLDVLQAGLRPRTPANAARYAGYPDGVTLGDVEAELALRTADGGAIEGTLRAPVLYQADGVVQPDHTLPGAGDTRPDHRLLAQGGWANGEFTGTWTQHAGGQARPLTFSRMRFERGDLRVLTYDPKAEVFGEAIIQPAFTPAPPPRPQASAGSR